VSKLQHDETTPMDPQINAHSSNQLENKEVQKELFPAKDSKACEEKRKSEDEDSKDIHEPDAKKPRTDANKGGLSPSENEKSVIASPQGEKPNTVETTPTASEPPSDEETPMDSRTEGKVSTQPANRQVRRALVEDPKAFEKKLERYIKELIQWLKRTRRSDKIKFFNEKVNKILENEKDEVRLLIVKNMVKDNRVKSAGKDIGIDKLFQDYMIPDDAKIYFEQIIESLNDNDQVSTETFEQKLNEILKKEETRNYKLVNEMEKLADAKKAQYDIWKRFEAMKVKEYCRKLRQALDDMYRPTYEEFRLKLKDILQNESMESKCRIVDALAENREKFTGTAGVYQFFKKYKVDECS